MSAKIGIGITAHNRPEVLKTCLENMNKFIPPGARLVIVDDASIDPVKAKEKIFRFNKNVGIAAAKNKCLEILDDCEHVFLFDEDTWPIADNWWVPYVESKEPHLMYIFTSYALDTKKPLSDCKEVYRDSSIVGYTHVRGCMLYVHHSVLDVVGGMDTAYGQAMFEHGDWTNRIFNAGLTTLRIMDVPDSHKLFYSSDEHLSVSTSIPVETRRINLRQMRDYYARSMWSTKYCSYKETDNYLQGDNNVILTSYFTRQVDPQRNIYWEADIDSIRPLLDSCKGYPLDVIILNDCWQEDGVFKPVESVMNPYFQRWLSQYQYLRDHPEIDKVFCVDATDVELVSNPFRYMEDKLYVGDESSKLNIPWMVRNHRAPFMQNFIRQNANKPLLNAGVVGGSREMVMNFCHDMIATYFDNYGKSGDFDMGLFNYVARTKYASKLEHGRKVTTVFKAYDKENTTSWFRHK